MSFISQLREQFAQRAFANALADGKLERAVAFAQDPRLPLEGYGQAFRPEDPQRHPFAMRPLEAAALWGQAPVMQALIARGAKLRPQAIDNALEWLRSAPVHEAMRPRVEALARCLVRQVPTPTWERKQGDEYMLIDDFSGKQPTRAQVIDRELMRQGTGLTLAGLRAELAAPTPRATP